MIFCINHGIFAKYVYSIFSNFINTPVRAIKVKVNTVSTTQYRLKTVALPIFNPFLHILQVRS